MHPQIWLQTGDKTTMDLYAVIGAILGSGLFIFAGRAPAQRVLAVIQRRRQQRR